MTLTLTRNRQKCLVFWKYDNLQEDYLDLMQQMVRQSFCMGTLVFGPRLVVPYVCFVKATWPEVMTASVDDV